MFRWLLLTSSFDCKVLATRQWANGHAIRYYVMHAEKALSSPVRRLQHVLEEQDEEFCRKRSRGPRHVCPKSVLVRTRSF